MKYSQTSILSTPLGGPVTFKVRKPLETGYVVTERSLAPTGITQAVDTVNFVSCLPST